jgi:hypothetical protein
MKTTSRIVSTALVSLGVSAAAACALAAPAQALTGTLDHPNGVNERVVAYVNGDELRHVQDNWQNSQAICEGFLQIFPEFHWDAGGAGTGLQRCADHIQGAAVYATQHGVTTGMYAVYTNYPGPIGWAVWGDAISPTDPT